MSSDDRRAVSLLPGELADASLPRTFYPGTQPIPGTVVSPMIADRDYLLRARFDWQAGDEGVVLALGDHFCGIVLFVQDGALHFTYQLWYRPLELAPMPLAPGAQDFVLRFNALGERKGCGSFEVNGQRWRDAVDLSPTMVRLPSGGLSVGINWRRPISERYAHRGTFRYSGAIDSVHIEPGRQSADTPMLLDEAAIQARMRAAAGAA